MSYRIAAASSDGIQIDLSFRAADFFTIIEVKENGSYTLLEKRSASDDHNTANTPDGCNNIGSGQSVGGCGGQSIGSCGGGHSDAEIEARVSIISDCRCFLCNKIGPGAERQLERKAITVFMIDLPLQVALTKIITYYSKLDNHIK
jgi:predicted Fe-Mo cluster-binding NifX family protein